MRAISRERRGAGQQQHEIGMLYAGDPDLLAIDDVAIAAAFGEGFDFGGVGAGGRLGDGERLQAKLTGCDGGQVAALLLFRAMAQQRAHDIHLRVACAGVGPGPVDLFEDDGSFGDAEASTAVLDGDERGEPSGGGERLHELFRIGRRGFDTLPVLAGIAGAELTDGLAVFGEIRGAGVEFFHDGSLGRGASVWSSDATESIAAWAVSGPKRGETRARNLASSSWVETGFSGLPRGKSASP